MVMRQVALEDVFSSEIWIPDNHFMYKVRISVLAYSLIKKKCINVVEVLIRTGTPRTLQCDLLPSVSFDRDCKLCSDLFTSYSF